MSQRDLIYLDAAEELFRDDKNEIEKLFFSYLATFEEILFDLTCDHETKACRKEPLKEIDLPIFSEQKKKLQEEEEKIPLAERKRRAAMEIYQKREQ